jgi:hypothetical protein
MILYAHCYRSGEIKISRKDDEPGMLCLGSGTGKPFRDGFLSTPDWLTTTKPFWFPAFPKRTARRRPSQPLTALLTF